MATPKNDSSNSTGAGATDNATIITDVLPTDILMGRGSRMVNHPGNACFRAVVKTYKVAYNQAGRTRNKQAIARQVLNVVVTQHNGRFLSMLDPAASGPHAEAWVLANEAAILEKVKQTLREPNRPHKHDLDTQQQGSVHLPSSQVEAHQIDAIESSSLLTDATTAGPDARHSFPAASSDILWQLQMANQEQALRDLQDRQQRERDILQVQHLLDLQQQHRMMRLPSPSITFPLASTIPHPVLAPLPVASPTATLGAYSGLMVNGAALRPQLPPPPPSLPTCLLGASLTAPQRISAATRSNNDLNAGNAISPSQLLVLRQILDRSSSNTGSDKRQKRN